MEDPKRMDPRDPLKDVVADCTRRWFQDALKEAKAGDVAMQIMVGQMYHVGYGVPINEQKSIGFCPLACDWKLTTLELTNVEWRMTECLAKLIGIAAHAWITKASKYRSSSWKFSGKHPGYGASDSDSSDVENIVVKS
ncbi:hypothetical protein ZIOFF_050054 [Zingiber officinale]|uniref:Uncharacterized protein n=1 Tax=Zingiber officinale TaxID=94328 RepID=A0A8J5FJP3_ZINOF|nr:hypothetical protein ZIOFF_050054 [Zingiber officinale]